MNRRKLIQLGLTGSGCSPIGAPAAPADEQKGPLVAEMELIRAQVKFRTVEEALDHFRKLVVGGAVVEGEPKNGFVVPIQNDMTERFATSARGEASCCAARRAESW